MQVALLLLLGAPAIFHVAVAAHEAAPVVVVTPPPARADFTVVPRVDAPVPVPAPGPVPVHQGELSLGAGSDKRCIELAVQALESGGLSINDVARAWFTRGRCHSNEGDAAAAERCYAVAVRVNPEMRMVVDDDAFGGVKGEGTAAATALTLQARAVGKPGDEGPVIVVAANDDLHLGAALSLVNLEGTVVAFAPLEHHTDEPHRAVKHRFSGIAVEGLRARLHDKHGNPLRDVAVLVDDEVPRAQEAAHPRAQAPGASATAVPITWVSYAGAGAAVAGVIGAASSGIALASSSQSNNAHDLDAAWLLGFVGAVAVVVFGSTLIVIDQVPTGSGRNAPPQLGPANNL